MQGAIDNDPHRLYGGGGRVACSSHYVFSQRTSARLVSARAERDAYRAMK